MAEGHSALNAPDKKVRKNVRGVTFRLSETRRRVRRTRLPPVVVRTSLAKRVLNERDAVANNHRENEGGCKGTFNQVEHLDEGIAGGSRGRFQANEMTP